jgi:putative SOS response-associated peptidase YedK
MFSYYSIRPDLVSTNRQSPEWRRELHRMLSAGQIHPGDAAPVLRGDENDGIPLAASAMVWGMPNLWMASKGLDPLAELVAFTTIDQDFGPRRDGEHHGYGRCLVPVTSFFTADGAELRDPDRPLLTLAGLVGSVEVDGVYTIGMCLLTQPVKEASSDYAAALAISPAHYSRWMDGWYSVAQVRNCCTPILRSRLGNLLD